MRLTASFSIREDTLAKLKEKLRKDNTYRNKSHLVERAIEKFLEGEE